MEQTATQDDCTRGFAVDRALRATLGMPLDNSPRGPIARRARDMKSAWLPTGFLTHHTETVLARRLAALPPDDRHA